jgi:hemerythrin-like metal-binding protein
MNDNKKGDDWLKVGSVVIDNQHKILFDLVKDVNNAVKAGVSVKILDVLLNVLLDYAFQHFQTEEEYLKDHADSAKHCLEHYGLLKRLNSFIVDFRNNRTKGIQAPSSFLEDWLFDHIERFDRPFFSDQPEDLLLVMESDRVDEYDSDIEDRRQHKRIAHNEVVDGQIQAQCYNATTLKSDIVNIINMSPGGLMLSSTRKHAIDDLLIITCSIGKSFKMKEKVRVRTARNNMYGVQFVLPARQTVVFFTQLYASVRIKHKS